MDQPKINPYIILIIGVISVSSSAILVKLSSAPSGVIAFYRLFFAVLIMAPLFLLKYVAEIRFITKKDWIYSVLSGILLAFHFILWFESLNYTSVASSTVLVTLQPLFAFIGTFFIFGERSSFKAILSAILAIIGCVIISWGDFQISGKALWGDILALIACALVTGYFLYGQNLRKRISVISYTFIVYSISSVVLLTYVIFNGEKLYPYSTFDWINFFLLAVVPTLLGHSLFNWAVKWISTKTISMAILFEPLGAIILAYIIFEETVKPTQWIGGILVLLGVIIFLRDERKIKSWESDEKIPT